MVLHTILKIQKLKKHYNGLTFIDPVADVATPSPLVDEGNKRIYISPERNF
jgi:hypothetical protein